MTILEKIITKYPNKNWNYKMLSKNLNISLEFIISNDKIRWDWYLISERVTYKEFLDNLKLPWNYYGLSKNPDIPFEYIKNNPKKRWDWKCISKRVTYKEFIDNPDLPWDLWSLSINTNMPIHTLGNIEPLAYSWEYISTRISYKDFINNPNLPWYSYGLIMNPNIPFEYIKNNLHKDWDWCIISLNISYKDFIDNPELPWEYKQLSLNPNIPIEYIKNNLYDNRNVNLYDNTNVNLNKKWNWEYISTHVLYEDYINNKHLPFNFDYSMNKDVFYGFLKNEPKMLDNFKSPWVYSIAMRSPFVTISDVEKYIDKINDFNSLSGNLFDYDEYFQCKTYKSKLAKTIMNIIKNDEKYIAKVYNPKRMRSYKDICELEELRLEYGWTNEEFDLHVK